MRFSLALPVALASALTLLSSSTLGAPATTLSKRELDPNDAKYSFTWREDSSSQYCSTYPPADFTARVFDDCSAQLSMLRDRRAVVYNWAFDALYADGSRVRQTPVRDFGKLSISDPDYTTTGGQNYRQDRTRGDYISVHDFTNVCRNGQAPVQFQFYVVQTLTATCAGNGRNWFKSRPINVVRGGSKAGQAPITSARRINSNGDYEVRWNAVTGAASYNIIYQTYTSGAGETPYYTTIRGQRVNAGQTSVVVATGTREAGRPRFFVVNVLSQAGVWNYAPALSNFEGRW
ncbi:hypothetical protein CBOM_06055 [Ceraceosorus bombacis]|uniref:Uncharacterized protein n=1 Tax=Ceraceosorus bombacis TaxID=401625 RepID=A0A0P1BIY6_9BASI|nr:hypothetical protein CBOM_06055 [Ceraceosorus bombacis]